ncbi:MAG TPA: TonB family protein, partial [Thermoanaerobaculia bacterium]|nr:TonB family protein [Thermoanaerobaculia bacterium]
PARVATVLTSVLLHAVILIAFVVVPLLARKHAPPIQYAPVVIVPQVETAPPAPKPKKTAAPHPAKTTPAPVKSMSVAKPAPAAKSETPREPKVARAAAVPPGPSIATLDNPDFTYGYYIDQMLSLIRANWQRPAVGAGVQAVVSFQIQRDGSITGIDISQSSGSPAFDFAGLRAVHLSSPLPPLPASFSGDSLGVNLILK